MKPSILVIFKREFQNYFNTPIGYVFAVVALFLNLFFFFHGIFGSIPAFWEARIASVESFMKLLPFTFVLLIPAVTMRLWAEERRQGTIELLRTMPFTELDLVLGKLFGAWAFVTLLILASVPLTVSVWLMGRLDAGATFALYLGSILMGGAYVSLGMFISSFTGEQIVAFVTTFFFSLVFFLINLYLIGQHLPPGIASFLSFFSLSFHFNSFSRGLIDLSDTIFYLSFMALMVFLNVLRLREEARV
jgi:ABC-2 type transport system permease protein